MRGAKLGDAHVHWHIAPLPSGFPYAHQQLHAVEVANGILDYSDTEMALFAARIRAALADESRGVRHAAPNSTARAIQGRSRY